MEHLAKNNVHTVSYATFKKGETICKVKSLISSFIDFLVFNSYGVQHNTDLHWGCGTVRKTSELQTKLECCGAKDYMDMDIVGFEFPKSCCRDQTKECRGPNDGMFINISPDELYFPVI